MFNNILPYAFSGITQVGTLTNYFSNTIFSSGEFDFTNNLWLDKSGNGNNAELVQSNCVTVDIADRMYFSTVLVGNLGDWVITSQGTAVPYIFANNNIRFTTEGTLYNMRVTNSVLEIEYFYPMCENSRTMYDCSGNGNHLTYYYQTIQVLTAAKQNDFHYNLKKGGSLWTPELFPTGNLEVAFTSGLALNLSNSSTLTRTEENIIVHSGTKAQRFTANTGYGVYLNIDARKGDTIYFKAWVYVVTGSAELSFDATYTNVRLKEPSEYSSTTGQWEYLEAKVKARSTGPVKCRMLATSDASDVIVDDISVRIKGQTILIPALESGLSDAVGNVMDVLPETPEYVETSINMPIALADSDRNNFFFTLEIANNVKLNNLQLALNNLVTESTIFYDSVSKKLVVYSANQNNVSVKRLMKYWNKPNLRLFRDYRNDFIYDWYNTINTQSVSRNYFVGIRQNRYVHYSADNGNTWSTGFDWLVAFGGVTIDISLLTITSKGSILVFRSNNTVYRSADGGVSFQEITVLGLDGNPLVKHTPSDPAYPGSYYCPYKRICDVYDSDTNTNVISWGNWGNKTEGNNPTYLYYSADDCATIKAFYLFGQNPAYMDGGILLGDAANDIIVRHIHEISYNPHDASHYVSTGDASTEIRVLKFAYNKVLDTWSVPIELLQNATQRQRTIQLGFDEFGYMYYASDGDPGVITQNDIVYNTWGLYKCLIEDLSDLSKHIELFTANDVIVNYLFDSGTIVLSVTKQHDESQDTNLYVSTDWGNTWLQEDYSAYSYYIDPDQTDYNPTNPNLILVDSDKNYLICGEQGSFFMNILK